MRNLVSILMGVLVFSVTTASPLRAERREPCGRLCAAMHAVSPYGDTEIYADVAEAAQRETSLLDPYTVVAIAFVESTLRQVVSERGTDVGLFQFATFETARRGIDEERLLSDVDYAFDQFWRLMREKKNLCEAKYPTTWFACWHSSNPRFHHQYAAKVKRFAALLRTHADKKFDTLTASDP